MHNKTKRNDHRRESKHLRKGWHDFCYVVKNLEKEDMIDSYLEKKFIFDPQQIRN